MAFLPQVGNITPEGLFRPNKGAAMKGHVHRRPISNEPSLWLQELIPKMELIPEGLILDIACGYGRNGSLLLSLGRRVHFIDINQEALDFIDQHYDKRLATIVNKDLSRVNLGYPLNSVAGIIMVHYFNAAIIIEAVNSLVTGGFLYYESIDDRGGNYLELPPTGWFRNNFKSEMEFDTYVERPSRHDEQKSIIRLFGRKIT